MTDRPPIVFVLGAGSSWPCGFPLGSDLVRNIITGTAAEPIFAHLDMATQFKNLKQALTRVGNQSVDDLLRTRTDLRDVARAAIAYEILFAEEEANLIPHTGDKGPRANDRWYPTLFRLLRKTAPDWEQFQHLPVLFITFNYDRSFDTYWSNALIEQFGWKRSIVASLEMKPIVHIHGQVGPCWWQGNKFAKYGTKPTAETIEQYMWWIRTPYETQDDDTHAVYRAQKYMESAHAAFFMGFAFDDLNFTKLSWPAKKPPHLFYSQYGIHSDDEQRRIREDIFNNCAAFPSGPDDMNAVFLERSWSIYTKMCPEWGPPKK